MLVWDNINNDASSFNISMRAGASKVFVEAYATSGMVANTPYAISFAGSGYNATVLVASIYAVPGVPERAVASGCMGWVQIRGNVEGVQASAAESTGSVGHTVFWTAAAIAASTSANRGYHQLGQIGVLTKAAAASTTLNMWLFGRLATAK